MTRVGARVYARQPPEQVYGRGTMSGQPNGDRAAQTTGPLASAYKEALT